MARMEAELTLKNAKFNTGLQESQARLNEFNEKLANPITSASQWLTMLPVIGGVIALIQAGIGTVRAFGEGLENAFKSAMKRQELIADFQAFYGSVDASKAKIKEFSDYARHTSFSTDDVAEGALRLEVLTNGAMQGAEALHTIGDVATDTGKSFTEVSTAVGFLYSRIASGGAFERPLMALENLGVITPVVSAKIKDMIDAGESTANTWKVVQSELDQFKGTTENVAATAGGSLDKIRKNTSALFQALAMPIVDAVTPWLKRLAEQSDETRTNLSSWSGVWRSFLSGASVATFGFKLFFTAGITGLTQLRILFNALMQVVGSDAYSIAVAASDVLHGRFSAAMADLRNGSSVALRIVRDAAKQIAEVTKQSAAATKADYAAMANSIAMTNNPGLAPDYGKDTKFDPEDGDEPAPGPAEVAGKRKELDDIEAAAREKTMTDLERINDLQKRRNDLLAQASAEQAEINHLDPRQDQGAIAHREAHKLDDEIAAARLAEQIGSETESREEKVAELKQKIQEHEDKLLDKTERLTALRKEESELDLNNADEEIRLRAKARKSEIDDEIKELSKGGREDRAAHERPHAGQPYQIAETKRHGGYAHHSMDELAGSMKLKLEQGDMSHLAPLTEEQKQTQLQEQMNQHLKQVEANTAAKPPAPTATTASAATTQQARADARSAALDDKADQDHRRAHAGYDSKGNFVGPQRHSPDAWSGPAHPPTRAMPKTHAEAEAELAAKYPPRKAIASSAKPKKPAAPGFHEKWRNDGTGPVPGPINPSLNRKPVFTAAQRSIAIAGMAPSLAQTNPNTGLHAKQVALQAQTITVLQGIASQLKRQNTGMFTPQRLPMALFGSN